LGKGTRVLQNPSNVLRKVVDGLIAIIIYPILDSGEGHWLVIYLVVSRETVKWPEGVIKTQQLREDALAPTPHLAMLEYPVWLNSSFFLNFLPVGFRFAIGRIVVCRRDKRFRIHSTSAGNPRAMLPFSFVDHHREPNAG
jgi:hypothetical protein